MSNKTQNHNSREFFLESNSGLQVIKEKIKYYKKALKHFEKFVDDKYEDWCKCDDSVKWYHDFIMKAAEKKKEQVEKKLKKFYWLRKKANGEVSENDLDVEGAKRVPAGMLLGGNAKYKSAGREKYLCPLHNESTASFTVYKEQNSWYCYGCGQGGDVIELYQQLHECNFKEAVRDLNKY